MASESHHGIPRGHDERRADTSFDWSDVGEREHFVQFYESEAFLLASVAGFIGAGLQGGDASIVISTAGHRQALERLWEARGIDLERARAEGRYVPLDTAETLARFMRHSWPQPRLFEQTVGGLIVDCGARHGRVRAFGEMVAQLWVQGNQTGAIRLEELWHKLGEQRAFALFCAYPLHGFAHGARHRRFVQICRHHTSVIPAESYTTLARADDRLRRVSELQQKAAALDAVLRERDALAAMLARFAPPKARHS